MIPRFDLEGFRKTLGDATPVQLGLWGLGLTVGGGVVGEIVDLTLNPAGSNLELVGMGVLAGAAMALLTWASAGIEQGRNP